MRRCRHAIGLIQQHARGRQILIGAMHAVDDAADAGSTSVWCSSSRRMYTEMATSPFDYNAIGIRCMTQMHALTSRSLTLDMFDNALEMSKHAATVHYCKPLNMFVAFRSVECWGNVGPLHGTTCGISPELLYCSNMASGDVCMTGNGHLTWSVLHPVVMVTIRAVSESGKSVKSLSFPWVTKFALGYSCFTTNTNYNIIIL